MAVWSAYERLLRFPHHAANTLLVSQNAVTRGNNMVLVDTAWDCPYNGHARRVPTGTGPVTVAMSAAATQVILNHPDNAN